MSQINQSIKFTKPHRNLSTALIILSLLALPVVAPRATGAVFVFNANLDGPSEFFPNASPGTGFADVQYDDVAHTLQVGVTFSGLSAGTTAAHIHSATDDPGTGTAGVATTTPSFAGFPLGVTSGSYLSTLDLTLASSYDPAFITANGGTPATAETALVVGMNAGKAYFNIHTTAFAGGEIRGFLTSVPEPSTIVLTGLGVVALAWIARRRN